MGWYFHFLTGALTGGGTFCLRVSRWWWLKELCDCHHAGQMFEFVQDHSETMLANTLVTLFNAVVSSTLVVFAVANIRKRWAGDTGSRTETRRVKEGNGGRCRKGEEKCLENEHREDKLLTM
jgi:hypothetical protein